MPKVQKTHQMSPKGEEWERKVTHYSLSLYPRDNELITYISEYLGCSKSEAVRTAIRLAAAQFAALPRAGTSTP